MSAVAASAAIHFDAVSSSRLFCSFSTHTHYVGKRRQNLSRKGPKRGYCIFSPILFCMICNPHLSSPPPTPHPIFFFDALRFGELHFGFRVRSQNLLLCALIPILCVHNSQRMDDPSLSFALPPITPITRLALGHSLAISFYEKSCRSLETERERRDRLHSQKLLPL